MAGPNDVECVHPVEYNSTFGKRDLSTKSIEYQDAATRDFSELLTPSPVVNVKVPREKPSRAASSK